MKYIIIFFLLPQFLMAQDFAKLVKEYQAECDEIVLDTIKVRGTIKYELLPVYDQGELVHYAFGRPDTVWAKPECQEYKHYPMFYLASAPVLNQSDGFFSLSKATIAIAANGHEVAIEKDHVCQVKRRKVEPFSTHFWEWILNRSHK